MNIKEIRKHYEDKIKQFERQIRDNEVRIDMCKSFLISTEPEDKNVEEKPSVVEAECCFNCFYFVKIDGGCLENNIPKPSDYAVNLKTFKCDYFKSIIIKF